MTDPVKTEFAASETPRVKERTARPSGLLPKNVQTWVVLGIALVMVLVIALSGNKAPGSRSSQLPAKTTSVVDPNEARIQEYRNRIDEDARRLAAEQERLRNTQEAIGLVVSASRFTRRPGPRDERGGSISRRPKPRGCGILRHKPDRARP